MGTGRYTPLTWTQRFSVWCVLSILICCPGVWAQQFVIDTPGGPITVGITHAGPAGEVVAPPPLEPSAFRPPSVFSAPLPSGSGARALGLAGAFTALADDATAASWNPAGLVQLERPEASAVYRYSRENNRHYSSDTSFTVGENDFSSHNLNYLSLVYPFRLKPIQRNAVISLNYQEAYDFTQQFTAVPRQGVSSEREDRSAATYQGAEVQQIEEQFDGATVRMEVTTYRTTEASGYINQLLALDLDAKLDFEQEGVLAAVTPALAVELTPRLSFGVALNYYRTDLFSGDTIRSRTRAVYSGASTSQVDSRTTRTTSGAYEYEGEVSLPGGGGLPPNEFPIDGSGSFEPFTDMESSRREDVVEVDGVFEEVNEFTDLDGINATLGLLWAASSHLSLGGTIDLPWTAEGRQTRTTRSSVTTYNADRTRVLETFDSENAVSKNVEFEFPLYWALGAVWRWNSALYTTLDVSQTLWSDFSFQAEGEQRVDPLDGSPHHTNPLDDTWAVRMGTEYLVATERTEVPLRAGLAWEERPALGQPDDFYSVSLGSGFSIGKEPGRVIFDLAYVLTIGNDVTSIVPEQPGLTSDVTEHQLFLSCIKHF